MGDYLIVGVHTDGKLGLLCPLPPPCLPSHQEEPRNITWDSGWVRGPHSPPAHHPEQLCWPKEDRLLAAWVWEGAPKEELVSLWPTPPWVTVLSSPLLWP